MGNDNRVQIKSNEQKRKYNHVPGKRVNEAAAQYAYVIHSYPRKGAMQWQIIPRLL